MEFEVDKIRSDFPLLSQKVHGHPIVYFDNGATTQKPRQVIETVNRYYQEENASIHRGVHFLSERSTETYEKAREKVRKYINAASTSEVIFTSGTTGSINALAFSFGEKYIWDRVRSDPHRDGTPLQHRSVADGLRTKGCQIEGSPI